MRSDTTYFEWLCERVDIWGKEEETADYLFKMLYSYHFILDENRSRAGLNLRQEFTDIYHAPDEELKTGPCTVFEMLVALAMSFSENADIPVGTAYHEMIRNLDLSARKTEYEVNRIVTDWLDGSFDKDGKGSPFPVIHYTGDVRILDLWSQMNIYIHERYPLSDTWLH